MAPPSSLGGGNSDAVVKKAGKGIAQLKKGAEMIIEELRENPDMINKDVKLLAADALAAGSSYAFGSGVKTYVEDGDGFLAPAAAPAPDDSIIKESLEPPPNNLSVTFSPDV